MNIVKCKNQDCPHIHRISTDPEIPGAECWHANIHEQIETCGTTKNNTTGANYCYCQVLSKEEIILATMQNKIMETPDHLKGWRLVETPF